MSDSQRLLEASRQGDLASLRAALEAGVAPDTRDSETAPAGIRSLYSFGGMQAVVDAGVSLGRTPLLEAAARGHVAIVEAMLQAGASLTLSDHLGFSALQLAAQAGHQRVLELLIQAGAPLQASHGPSPLLLALESDRSACAHALLDAGAEVKGRLDGQSALGLAASHADADLVKRLLALKAPLKTLKNHNPLLLQAVGACRMVPLAKGEERPQGGIVSWGADGCKVMRPYPEDRVLEVVELILGVGVDVNEPGISTTALGEAVRWGHRRVVERLLAAGASPESGLEMAKLFSQSQIAELLGGLSTDPPVATPEAKVAAAPRPRRKRPELKEAARSAEFQAALSRLEQLWGVKSSSPAALRGGKRLRRPQEADIALLQEEFLKSAAFLVIDGDETAALLPCTDPLVAVGVIGTEAPNFDLDNFAIVDWLAELRQEYPFRIFEVRHDRIEGVFVQPIAASKAKVLARRMYKFCPDLVEQGCGSQKELARLLTEQPAQLYFWWD